MSRKRGTAPRMAPEASTLTTRDPVGSAQDHPPLAQPTAKMRGTWAIEAVTNGQPTDPKDYLVVRLLASNPTRGNDMNEQTQQERIDGLATSWKTPNGLMVLTSVPNTGRNWVVMWIVGNTVIRQESLGAETLQDALAELADLIDYNKQA